jgi:hypothetical protein
MLSLHLSSACPGTTLIGSIAEADSPWERDTSVTIRRIGFFVLKVVSPLEERAQKPLQGRRKSRVRHFEVALPGAESGLL